MPIVVGNIKELFYFIIFCHCNPTVYCFYINIIHRKLICISTFSILEIFKSCFNFFKTCILQQNSINKRGKMVRM